MPEALKNKKQEKDKTPLKIEFFTEYVEKQILELQSIRDQYSGAIEAYKDILNKIQEQEQKESDSDSTETSVDS